ncbi:hypothetical protein ACWIG4_18280 [Streptomyces sp. NPDC002248]
MALGGSTTRLDFVLSGRDALSRTLDRAGDSAERMRERMNRSAADAARSLGGFTQTASGRLRDLEGNLISTEEATRRLRDGVREAGSPFAETGERARKFGEELRGGLLHLAPAAIPALGGMGAAVAAVGAQLGTGAVAAGAFALALGPQISALGEAREAQKKYEDAVEQSGRTSQEALKAQAEYQRQMAKLPPETQRAAVAVGLLKDNFQDWSDSLAGDVMGPVNKGIAVANTLLPKTSGLVKGASTQFDRLITLVGGAVNTPGFDRLMARFTEYSDRTLSRAVDGTVRFIATAGDSKVGGGITSFFAYCRDAAPDVLHILENLGTVVLNVIQAGSETGVGMLQLVNALSGIAAAVPPEVLSTLLQLAVAIKAVKLAAAGGAVIQAAFAGVATQVTRMQAASIAAPGALRGVGAAISGMSKSAKLAMAGTGLGLLIIALGSISQASRKAPPDVDKLTTSLGKLGDTGKLSGEAVRAYGRDLSGLADSLRTLARPSNAEGIQQWATRLIGMDSTPVKNAKQDLDAVDKSLANLVTQGHPELASAAFDRIAAAMQKQGLSSKNLRGELDGYKGALEAQALEQKLAADSMGLFGEQAQKVQAQLDAQKQSADGLRQSIVALNDANRSALGGQIGFEAALDAASKAAKENAGALDMRGGKLVLDTEKSRTAAQALNDLAAKTDEATTSARESGASWSEVAATYDRGRAAFVRSAEQMGLTRAEAKRLADQILKTPDKTAYLRGNKEDLDAKVKAAQAKVDSLKQKRKTAVGADKADLDRKISAAQAKVNSLKQKRAVAIRATNQVNGAVNNAVASLLRVKDRNVQIRAVFTMPNAPGPWATGLGGRKDGGLIKRANGGPIPGFPGGGLLRGPGTSTSDSILMWGSNGEYMIKAASVAKYGTAFMDAINSGRLPTGKQAAPGRAAAAPAAAPAPAGQPHVTYAIYPRSSVIDAADLRLIQRQEEAKQRVGRPR